MPITSRSKGLEGFAVDALVVGAWALAWLLVIIGLAGNRLPSTGSTWTLFSVHCIFIRLLGFLSTAGYST